MYVDNELESGEKKEVEQFINTNNEAKSKVENYRRINNFRLQKGMVYHVSFIILNNLKVTIFFRFK